MEASEQIILELLKTIKSFKEDSLQVHKKVLLESQQTNKIYIQILSALRHQNVILDELKRTGRLTVSQ